MTTVFISDFVNKNIVQRLEMKIFPDNKRTAVSDGARMNAMGGDSLCQMDNQIVLIYRRCKPLNRKFQRAFQDKLSPIKIENFHRREILRRRYREPLTATPRCKVLDSVLNSISINQSADSSS